MISGEAEQVNIGLVKMVSDSDRKTKDVVV